MVELQVIHNPNYKISWVPGNYTVRKFIIFQKTSEGKQIFLVITKKWVSYAWKYTFLIQLQKKSKDFVPCSKSWLLHRGFKGGKIQTHMGDYNFKHLDPAALNMSVEAECDEAKKIMTTQEE